MKLMMRLAQRAWQWVWHWRWRIYALAVLGVLVYSSFYRPKTLPELLAIAVIFILLPLSWNVTWNLGRLVRAPEPTGKVLIERFLTALDLSLVVTVFAGVFLNNGMEHPILEPFWTMVITRTVLLQLAGPLLYWLRLYRNGDH